MFIGDFVVGNRRAIRMEESICIQIVKLNQLGEILFKGSVIGSMYFEHYLLCSVFSVQAYQFLFFKITVNITNGQYSATKNYQIECAW